ncbi:MAG: hypothetical protein KDJ24_07340, partial [Gammaproteobacteria bacterium]|nr:hypothetical protein [Gammaproteobacteria bacterium]
WGALSFAFFSLGKQRKEGWVRSTERIKTHLRASARTTPQIPRQTVETSRHNKPPRQGYPEPRFAMIRT